MTTNTDSVELPDDRIPLPDGHWVKVVDPKTVSERQRRPMKATYTRFVLAMQKVIGDAQSVVVEDGVTPDPTKPAAAGGSIKVDVDELLDATEAFQWEAISFCTAEWGGPELDGVAITPDSVADLPVPSFEMLSEATRPTIEILFPIPKVPTPEATSSP